MSRRLPILLLALALGGCVLGDCAFETSEARTIGGVVLADGTGVGDTLDVVFLQTAAVPLAVEVDAGVGVEPAPTPDGAVELLYDAVALAVSGLQAPRPLVATTRGDTVFVYVLGTVDPVTLACSPPLSGVEVRVREVLVPAGVAAARVSTLDLAALDEPTAAALRQSAAARRAARPITA